MLPNNLRITLQIKAFSVMHLRNMTQYFPSNGQTLPPAYCHFYEVQKPSSNNENTCFVHIKAYRITNMDEAQIFQVTYAIN